jgi:Protein NO VEIN, C-terminal
VPPEPTEADSEEIAMRLVAAELRNDGWAVSDVHKEGRGYDLYAVRGRAQRCVEVKGVWNSASSSGVRLTGDELLIARQMARDYWLYVGDECSQGGAIYCVYQDPVQLLGDLIRDVALVRIPGSALKPGRHEACPA